MKSRYDKQFKGEAVRLSDEIGVKRSAEQLGGTVLHADGVAKKESSAR